jgi:hypothetical protein
MQDDLDIMILQDALHNAVEAYTENRNSVAAYQEFMRTCTNLWMAKIHRDLPDAAAGVTKMRAMVVALAAIVEELDLTVNSITSAVTIKVAQNGISAEECKNAANTR